jgi:cytochrome c553
MWRLAVVPLLLGLACQPAAPPAEPASEPPAAAAVDVSRDQLLLASTKLALPPPGITAADLPDPSSAGAGLLATHCTQCHELPSPAMHSATDWPGVLRRMWLRMDRLPASLAVAVPDAGARAAMLSYMTVHALPVSAATLPAGAGREEFVATCGRCHALPDVRVHAPEDWLTVLLRMERNMERMNVTPATPAETAAIITYLQAASASR